MEFTCPECKADVRKKTGDPVGCPCCGYKQQAGTQDVPWWPITTPYIPCYDFTTFCNFCYKPSRQRWPGDDACAGHITYGPVWTSDSYTFSSDTSGPTTSSELILKKD
jgi:hypothetical protein